MSISISIFKWIALTSLSLSYAFFITYCNNDRLYFRGDITSGNPSVLTIYWDHYGDFTDKVSNRVNLLGNKWNSVAEISPPIKNQSNIRIDPIQDISNFSFSDFHVFPFNLVYPFTYLLSFPLNEEAAIVKNTIYAHRTSTNKFISVNTNPNFTWNLPSILIDKFYIFLLNFLSFWCYFFISVLSIKLIYVTTRTIFGNDISSSRLATTPLVLFPLFCAFISINKHYIDLSDQLGIAFFWTFAIFIVVNILLLFKFTYNSGAWISLLISILFIISFDTHFHFKKNEKYYFSIKRTPVYHWKFLRTASDNLRASSLPYYGDFKALEEIVKPKERFFSDVATSYYIAAALPIYMASALSHHRKRSMFSVDTILGLCNSTSSAEFKTTLDKEQTRITRAGSSSIKYFVLNFDTSNQNVTKSCISRNRDILDKYLSNISSLIFVGEYLKVYKLRYDT